MTSVRRVRVPARVAAHVLDPALLPPETRLAATIQKVPPRKDGSRLVIVDDREAADLLAVAEHLEADTSGPTGDRLARVRAAQAIRKALR